MSKFPALLVALLMLAGCSSGSQPDGALIYANNCSSCHGADLGGGRGVPLDAGSEAASKSDDEYLVVIRSGTGIMPSYQGFSDEQVAAVIAYLRRLQRG